ncbi:winged helix-turn-helix domain-containing protein [Dyadobacter sediminis]|uniref:LysR family transcriptional regulator n=1 Tax=Dyadobacter sediminis TaxID=1493691 RepID=A0A5R9K6M6_9BACT|nr:winged helix-turn-helix domain-containing protein [Dyadobacter sediminis]TLU89445.1 LysR family transcriptional regulator [Dyadobacter sediminis]GGC05356.1 LysR family transcriptional regulator [Dyadobacter sediminis]
MDKKTEIRIRHWVFVDDTKFFGPGRYELLEHIAETGSISKAAGAMKLSYKKAWAMVDAMNALGSSPYVITQKGGSHGGGAVLTETGKRVMEAYKSLNEKLLEVVKAEKELLQVI